MSIKTYYSSIKVPKKTALIFFHRDCFFDLLFLLPLPRFYLLQTLGKTPFQSFLRGMVIASALQGLRQAFHGGDFLLRIMGIHADGRQRGVGDAEFGLVFGIVHFSHSEEMAFYVPAVYELHYLGAGEPAVYEEVVEGYSH